VHLPRIGTRSNRLQAPCREGCLARRDSAPILRSRNVCCEEIRLMLYSLTKHWKALARMLRAGRHCLDRTHDRRPLRRRPWLEPLEDRTVPSAVLHLGVVGDSAPYAGTPSGSAGDREWTEVLQTLRPGLVQITNLADQSATSASMIATGQVAA